MLGIFMVKFIGLGLCIWHIAVTKGNPASDRFHEFARARSDDGTNVSAAFSCQNVGRSASRNSSASRASPPRNQKLFIGIFLTKTIRNSNMAPTSKIPTIRSDGTDGLIQCDFP